MELVLSITDFMSVKDISKLAVTCSRLNHLLSHTLYRRKVQENDYYDAVMRCVLDNQHMSVAGFMLAGARLYDEAAWAAYGHPLTHFTDLNNRSGIIVTHPLLAAASMEHNLVVRALVMHNDEEDVANKAREDVVRHEALLVAIDRGFSEIVAFLIYSGVSPTKLRPRDSTETIPLVRAAMAGDAGIVRAIASYLKRENSYSTRTYHNQRYLAFFAAVKHRHSAVVQFFLGDGLNPNLSRRRHSFLHTAVTSRVQSRENRRIIQMLLAARAITSDKDPGVIQACWSKLFDNAQIVLNHGCFWSYSKKEVKYAQVMARHNGRHDVETLLQDYLDKMAELGYELPR